MTSDAPAHITFRPVTADEMIPLLSVTTRAFGDDPDPDRHARNIASMKLERTLAAVDGDAIVAHAAIYTLT